MTTPNELALARLLQLASPTLPVGAFSYSQGLESAVEAGLVKNAGDAARWIEDLLVFSVAQLDAPIVLRVMAAWQAQDIDTVADWNAYFLASRETRELRAETVQMGYSLRRLLDSMQPDSLVALDLIDEPSFPTMYAVAAAQWNVDSGTALIGYLWSWLENQVMAALKIIPLGQSDGQRLLFQLGESLPRYAARAAELDDDSIGAFAPGFVQACVQHETQYSRLFRS
jgi:urease accessory protein